MIDEIGRCCNTNKQSIQRLYHIFVSDFSNKVLSRSGGITEFVTLRWDLTLTLLLAWTIVFLCLIKGIKSSGKVCKFSQTYAILYIPYLCDECMCISDVFRENPHIELEMGCISDLISSLKNHFLPIDCLI